MSPAREKIVKHIAFVQKLLGIVIRQLENRSSNHDKTKLVSPEIEVFEQVVHRLSGLTYGSDEYMACLAEMKLGLDHHYANNSHHPEYYSYSECNGCFKRFPKDHQDKCDVCGYGQFTVRPNVAGMNLLDLIEMICDWKAASTQHSDGDIVKSVDINQKRFGYSDELKQIFLNTLPLLEEDNGN